MKKASLWSAILLSFLVSSNSWAKYPEDTISIIVPFTAGGFTDKVARLVAEGISPNLDLPVIVENRPGAAGALALSKISRAKPDGYTLFLSNTATDGINPSIYVSQEVDPAEVLSPVILVVKTPNLVGINKDLKVKTLGDLVQLAADHPQEIYFGTPGIGTTGHLTGELFNDVANIKLEHVPYKGSAQVLSDLIGGEVQVTFDNITTLASQVDSGSIRGLAITGANRSPLLPDVPTIAESGFPGFETTSWSGFSVPQGTPKEIIEQLNHAINAVIQTDDFKDKMNGGEVIGGSAKDFQQFMIDERKKWGNVVRKTGLTIE